MENNSYDFSLIIPTLGREHELKRLLDSIARNQAEGISFEVIIVDQNDSLNLEAICECFSNQFPLKQVKVHFKGASRARNYGALLAKGRILNFPDDDCEYSDALLVQVKKHFSVNNQLDVLFGKAIDPVTGRYSVTRFSNKNQTVHCQNIYQTTVEFTMFIGKQIFMEVGMFDEALGVGTFYGAEEGADFVLRALSLGKKIYYDSSLVFYHPSKIGKYNRQEFMRGYCYGKGFGKLVVKSVFDYHEFYLVYLFFKNQIRAVIACLLYLAVFKLNKSFYYLCVITGRTVGLIMGLLGYLGIKTN